MSWAFVITVLARLAILAGIVVVVILASTRRRPKMATPAASWSATCDWGDCDGLSVGWRWDAAGQRWLPVCADHVVEEVRP